MPVNYKDFGHGVAVRYQGPIEVGPRYRLVNGYAVVVDNYEWHPHMTWTEACKLARSVAAERRGDEKH